MDGFHASILILVEGLFYHLLLLKEVAFKPWVSKMFQKKSLHYGSPCIKYIWASGHRDIVCWCTSQLLHIHQLGIATEIWSDVGTKVQKRKLYHLFHFVKVLRRFTFYLLLFWSSHITKLFHKSHRFLSIRGSGMFTLQNISINAPLLFALKEFYIKSSSIILWNNKHPRPPSSLPSFFGYSFSHKDQINASVWWYITI